MTPPLVCDQTYSSAHEEDGNEVEWLGSDHTEPAAPQQHRDQTNYCQVLFDDEQYPSPTKQTAFKVHVQRSQNLIKYKFLKLTA